MRHLCAVIATTLLAGSAFADTINVPGDYVLIQDAIDASSDGDMIEIAAGTYNEHSLNTGGRAITIQGTLHGDGTLATTIDAQQGGGVFRFDSGEGLDTVIKDLVITGGASSSGAGIRCGQYGSPSTPTITNCAIINNTSTLYGGGIFMISSNCNITGCTISGNSASGGSVLFAGGGGIYITSCSPTISNCTISNNHTYLSGRGNNPEGYGGGVCITDIDGAANPSFINCIVSGNDAVLGGGICCWEGQATLSGTIVCDNEPDLIYGPWTDNGGNELVEECPSFAGACCTNGECVTAEQADCLAFHGTWLGAGTTCDASPCPAPCPGDVTGDGQVNVEDLLIVIANWNNCP